MSLVLTDIISQDYVTLFNEIKTLKNSKSNLVDWDIDNPNDIIRFTLDYYLLAIERLARFANNTSQEFNIATSLTRENIINHALQLQYIPTNYVSSHTLINFVITSSGSSVVAPAYSIVLVAAGNDGNAVYFTNIGALTFALSTTALNNQLFVEGVYTERLETSKGRAFTSIIVRDRIVDNTVRVFLNATEWTEIDSLLNAGSSSTRFLHRQLDEETHQFVFGDDTNGKIPVLGETIKISYLKGGGSRGNVLAGKITSTFTIPSSLNGRITSLTNPADATGGRNPDSIERIRSLAIRLPRLNNRLVNDVDITTFCESYDGVARANVTPHINFPIVQIIPDGGGNPSNPLKDDVKAAVDEIIVSGYKVGVVNPKYITVTLELTIYTDPNYDQSTIQTYANEQIDNLLDPLNLGADGNWTRDFGEPVLLSEIYDLLINFPGVLSVEVVAPVTTPNSDILFECEIDEIFTNVGSTVTINLEVANTASTRSKLAKTVMINPKYKS